MTQSATFRKKPAPIIPYRAMTGEEETIYSDHNVDPSTQKFRSSILDQKKEYSAPVPVISFFQNAQGIPLLTKKSFSLWQGKQKSRKTTALAMMIAAFLKGHENRSETGFFGEIEGTAIFFDNEQGESYAARTMKLILKIAGLECSEKLIYCDLREFSPVERMKIIRAGIECTPGIALVVIDGLVDLLSDFMDAGEGHSVTTEILRLCSAYDIHIAGVLHQNKNDKNPRAHIGTISSQKCEIEITTEVDLEDRTQSIVSCVNSRGLPFEPFAIRWEKGSLPCIAQEYQTKSSDAKSGKNYERSKEIAEAIFRPLKALSHADAINQIMNTALKSESTAKRMLKDFELWNMIEKGSDGKYRKKMPEGSKVHEGSDEGS